jgi:ATP-binding cassette, subfamily C, bacterial CydD
VTPGSSAAATSGDARGRALLVGAGQASANLALALLSAVALAALAHGALARGLTLLATGLSGRWLVGRLVATWDDAQRRRLRSTWRARLVGALRRPRPAGERARGDLALAIDYAAREPALVALDAGARASLAGLALVWWAGGALSAGIVLVLLGVAVPLYRRAGTRSAALEADYQRRRARLESRQLELLFHAPDLRALGAVAYGADEIGALSDAEHVLALRAIRVALGSSLVTEFLSGVSVGLVAMVSGFALLGGRLSLEHALVAVLATTEIFAAVRRAGTAFHQREQAVDGRALLDELTEAPAPGSADVLLRCRDLVSAAGGATLTLEVVPGTRVLVRGPSGSGKTTLLETLVGWRAPRAGEVARGPGRVGMVSAESALLSGSIWENLTLGREITEARVREVLDLLGLDGARFADLGAPLLVDGRGLSGGERVRVALARCLLAHVDLLVLDDVAGVLDEVARERVAHVLALDPRLAVIEATTGSPLLEESAELVQVRP